MRVKLFGKAKAAVARLGAKSIWSAIALLALSSAAIANPAAPYSQAAPIEAYLMQREAEIALARSAAPRSVSEHATILVLTRTGYEIAVAGDNGFVCMVGRGFGGPFDWPERLSPRIRAAECLNPPAARTVLPFALVRTDMFLAGRTMPETVARIRNALSSGEIPPLEPGAMSYMMARGSYLSDDGHHNMSHVMFFAPLENGDWGANATGSPIIGGSYWYVTPDPETQIAVLPTISVFLIEAAHWSDGAPASAHPM